jgi:hypothetical protein
MTSIIKVNNLQNQCGANTINKCGTAITVGASGDTVTLAAGASQSGFGQTYSAVSWDTTPKTTTITGVAGVGYFVNTSGGAVTANLPAGTAGDVIAFADYTNTFQTNALTITPNGSEKINGGAGSVILSTEGQSLTLVYVDSTEGWKSVQDSTTSPVGNNFIAATGGTETISGDYKIHTFTGPGTFTVSSAGNPLGSSAVDYLAVAGGGGGGGSLSGTGGGAGGGGAGGYRESSGAASGCYTASPLGACVSALPVTATAFPITVGGGGGGNVASPGTDGSNSVFSTIISTGGGGAGSRGPSAPTALGRSGGSGGGAGHGTAGAPAAGGSGNTPPVSPPQGNNGANFPSGGFNGGGGGGASAAASNANGANGVTSSINATPTARGGGGGGASSSGAGTGGTGGGGAGNAACGGTAPSGTSNTGGGGGGSGHAGSSPSIPGGAGGSGIVIIRYKFQ